MTRTSSLGHGRAIALAVVAALLLPGGIALSSYSGPPPKTHHKFLTPPWSDSRHTQSENCGLLSECLVRASDSARSGDLAAVARVTSTAGGLAPDTGSNASASATMHIVDNFGGGTHDYARYVFYVTMNNVEVTYPRPLLPFVGPYGYASASIEFSATPQKCFGYCGSYPWYYDLYGGEFGVWQFDVYVSGPFRGPVDLYAKLSSSAFIPTLGVGRAVGDADVTISRVERIWTK